MPAGAVINSVCSAPRPSSILGYSQGARDAAETALDVVRVAEPARACNTKSESADPEAKHHPLAHRTAAPPAIRENVGEHFKERVLLAATHTQRDTDDISVRQLLPIG